MPPLSVAVPQDADTLRLDRSARGVRRGRRPSPWIAALLAACSLCAGLQLAAHYPLSGAWASLVWLLVAAACWRWPRAWLIGLPAALPLIGGTPWTGWLTFEEWD